MTSSFLYGRVKEINPQLLFQPAGYSSLHFTSCLRSFKRDYYGEILLLQKKKISFFLSPFHSCSRGSSVRVVEPRWWPHIYSLRFDISAIYSAITLTIQSRLGLQLSPGQQSLCLGGRRFYHLREIGHWGKCFWQIVYPGRELNYDGARSVGRD